MGLAFSMPCFPSHLTLSTQNRIYNNWRWIAIVQLDQFLLIHVSKHDSLSATSNGGSTRSLPTLLAHSLASHLSHRAKKEECAGWKARQPFQPPRNLHTAISVEIRNSLSSAWLTCPPSRYGRELMSWSLIAVAKEKSPKHHHIFVRRQLHFAPTDHF